MRKYFLIQSLLFIVLTFKFQLSFSQSTSHNVIGNWQISKIENLNKDENKKFKFDENEKSKILSFKSKNEVETFQIINGKKKVIGSGTYKISDDGKYFFQDNEKYEIISFEKDEFAVKVSADIIFHFKRMTENIKTQ